MRKKIALLLSIIMIIASMPITAFAVPANVYGYFDGYQYYQSDEHLNKIGTLMDGNTVTNLIVSTDISCLTLENQENLKSVKFDHSATTVGYKAFKNFVNLEDVDLTNVNDIDRYAFYNTGIKTLNIPSTVYDIAPNAFMNCRNLDTVHNSSDSSFSLILGGVQTEIPANSDKVVGLRLAKSDFAVDRNQTSAQIQLEPMGANPNDMRYLLGNTSLAKNSYSVDNNGLLSVTINNPNTEDYTDTIIVRMTDGSNVVDASVSVNYSDINNKRSIIADQDDGYKYDFVEGQIGTDVMDITKPYVLEFSDKYGELFDFDAICDGGDETHHMYSYLPYYTFENRVVLNSDFVNTEIVRIFAEVGKYMTDPISDGVNVKSVELPYSGGGVIDENDSKINIYSNQEFNFTDIYKVEVDPFDHLDVKVCDNSSYTHLYVAIITCDAGNNPIDYKFYNSNNYNGAGEEIEHRIGRDAKYAYIYVSHGTNTEFMGDDYKIEISKGKIKDQFPVTVSVEDKFLDFDRNNISVTNEQGKYSWDSTTKTLTLEDGFFIKNRNTSSGSATPEPAIKLPANSTIVVNGKAGISSRLSGIEFAANSPDNINKIIMKKGSSLKIFTTQDSIAACGGQFAIKGEADENGNLPKLDIDSNHKAITSKLSSPSGGVFGGAITIDNVDMNIQSGDEGIEGINTFVSINNSKVDINSNKACINIVKKGLDPVPGLNPGLDVNSSTFNTYGIDSAIFLNNGNVNIVDSDSKIYQVGIERRPQGAIDIEKKGNVAVSGGSLDIHSCYVGISNIHNNKNSISLDTPNLSIIVDSSNSRFSVLAASGGELTMTGQYNGISSNDVKYNDLSAADLISKVANFNVLAIRDENSANNPGGPGGPGSRLPIFATKAIIPVGTPVENVDTSVFLDQKASYTKGEDVVINVSPTENNNTIGALRYMPASWAVEGTDLKGSVEREPMTISFSTQNLAVGEHSIVVTYVKQVLDNDGAWINIKDNEGNDITTQKAIKILVVEPEQELLPGDMTDNSADTTVKSPETGAELGLAFGGILMLGLSLSLVTITNRKKKTNK